MSSTTIAAGATTSPAARPDRRLVRQIARFLVIGGCSAAVDFGCYTLLLGSMAVSTEVAKGIAYLTGMAFGFFGNKFWTFESRRRSITEPVLYVGWYAITLGVNIGANSLLLAAVGPRARLFAFLAATALTTLLNFLGLRLIAFRAALRNAREPLGSLAPGEIACSTLPIASIP